MANKQQEGNEVLQATIESINKKYGKGSVMKLGETNTENVPVISTGVKILDYALGCMGIPKGRIIEIFGEAGSSKTTLATTICAQAQLAGGKAAYVDSEHAFDPSYARSLGVNTDELLFAQPTTGEEALDIVEKLALTNMIDVIIVDSVASLVPKAELAGEIGDAHIALLARLMSQGLRRLAGILGNTNTAVIFINQNRQNISVTGYGGGGDITTGGKALKYYTSIRLDLRKTEWIKKGEEIIGQKVKIKVVKNKLAPPYKIVELELLFGKGYSTEGMLIDLALNIGILERKGAWFYYKDEKIAQGKEKVRELLQTDETFRQNLEHDLDTVGRQDKTALTIDELGENTAIDIGEIDG